MKFTSRSILGSTAIALGLLAASFVAKATPASAATTGSYRIVGYMPDWQGDVSTIQYSKLTHICYAFLQANTNGSLDTSGVTISRLQQLTTLAHASGTKVIISLGGWSNGSALTTAMRNTSARATLATNCVNFINQYNLDGFDFDWEGPADVADGGYWSSFMQAIYGSLHPAGKLTTSAVASWFGGNIPNSAFAYIDFANIMAYDNEGLQHSDYNFAVSQLSYWVGKGIPISKCVLGVPFYGYAVSDTSHSGGVAYNTLVANNANAAYSDYSSYSGGVYYNGLPTIKQKTNYVVSQGAGGIMIWELSMDTTNNTSLLSAIYSVLSGAPTTNYTITASAGTGGTISPSGNVSVSSGASQTFTITPASGYTVNAVTVDGTSKGALTSYTFSNVTAAHIISATFASSGAGTYPNWVAGTNYSVGDIVKYTNGNYYICTNSNPGYDPTISTWYWSPYTGGTTTYTITANAGTGGTISPSGNVSVSSGASQSFTITPASGYIVNAITVDGTSKGALTSYTFSNVTAAHTISATFSAIPISTNLALGKTATASSVEVSPMPAALAIDGNTGTRWSSAYADPTWITIDLGSAQTFNRVVLRWEAAYGKTYQIQTSNNNSTWTTVYTQNAGTGGTEDLTFASTTARYVRLNGTARGTQWGYSLWEFEVYNTGGSPTTTYAITASAGTGGTISPSGNIIVSKGSSQTFTITPASNYTVNAVTVDGSSQGAITSYTFSNVTATHTLTATFTASSITIPPVPAGLTATVNSSSQITVTWSVAANATGYDLLADGVTVTGVTSPYAHSGLSASSAHTYEVRSKNQAGTSAWSASVSATTSSSSISTLTLGEVANPNGRYFCGYYPTWSDNWFTVTNWDGTKKSDNDIYTASNLAKVPGVYTHVMLAFAQPNFSWSGISANSWSGTGLNFNATPADIKEVIRLMHILKKKVIIAVGGATYNSWSGLAAEAGVSGGPIKTALTKIMVDLDIDGLDVDYEVIGADSTTVNEYAHAIQAMREAVDAAGSGRLLTVAAWSTGADYTAATSSDAGFPGVASYWSGAASRERQSFKLTVSSGQLSGRKIVSLFDVVNIMSYDAQTYHYDPVTAYDQYRALAPSSVVISIGLEIPPEGWAGGILVINNSDASADGTIVVADQYGRTPRGAYSVERFGKYVLANTLNTNPHDGLMLWQILKTQSVSAGSAQSANATTVAQKVTSLFGYVPSSP